MIKKILIRQWVIVVVMALLFLLVNSLTAHFFAIGFWVWSSILFLALMFSFVNYIIHLSLATKSHMSFMTFFALAFGLKVFGALIWLIGVIFLAGIKSTSFVAAFFAVYFILTFHLVAEVWQATKRK